MTQQFFRIWHVSDERENKYFRYYTGWINHNYIVQSCTLLYKVLHCCAELYTVVQSFTGLYTVVQSSTLLYRIVQSCTLCYRVLQVCTLLYRVVQSCTLLYRVNWMMIILNHIYSRCNIIWKWQVFQRLLYRVLQSF